jgi:putative hydrolase
MPPSDQNGDFDPDRERLFHELFGSELGPLPGNLSPEQMQDILGQIINAASANPGHQYANQVAMAAQIANEGNAEANVDPADRMRIESMSRIAAMHVADVAQRSLHDLEIEAVTKTRWVETTLSDFAPYTEALADLLGRIATTDVDPGDIEALIEEGAIDLPPGIDPAMLQTFQQLVPGMPQLMRNVLGAGLVGHLARRSFGYFDMPLPRPDNGRLLLIAANIREFIDEWDLPADNVALWVCTQELAGHLALRSPGLRRELDELILTYVRSFESLDAESTERLLESEPDLVNDPISGFLSDPQALFRALESPAQRELRPRIDRLVGVTIAYIDWIVDQVTARILPDGNQIAEAVRRRRVENGIESKFVQGVFGLGLSRSNLERGREFLKGVIDRGGTEALESLLDSRENLPTDNEYAAPGLWLARRGYEIEAGQLDDMLADLEVPDYFDADDLD